MSIHDQIEDDRSYYDEENKLLTRYREYARGKQLSLLTQVQKDILKSCDEHVRADNIVHQINFEAANRLEFDTFTVDDIRVDSKEQKPPAVQALCDFIHRLTIKTAYRDLWGEKLYDMNRDGNKAVMAGWKPNGTNSPPYGRNTFTLENWWDGTQGVFIYPETDGREPYAVKDRILKTRMGDGAANVLQKTIRFIYFEDRIEKYQRDTAGGWEPYEDPDDDKPGITRYPNDRHITAWTKDGRILGPPLHIPLVHFANAGRMFGIQGVAEASGGLLAFQDDLNKIVASAVAAALFLGFPIPVVKGFTVDETNVDAEGRPKAIELVFELGTFLQDSSKDFDAKMLEGADPARIETVKKSILESVARTTGTARHVFFSSEVPSGIAMVEAQRPSINKAKRQAAKVGPAAATLIHRAVEQANVFGKAGLDEDLLIETVIKIHEGYDPKHIVEVERLEFDLEQDRESAKRGVAPNPVLDRLKEATGAQGAQ